MNCNFFWTLGRILFVIGALSGCSLITDFDDFRIVKEMNDGGVDAGNRTDTDKMHDSGPSDSGAIIKDDASQIVSDASNERDSGTVMDSPAGKWRIERSHDDFRCGTFPTQWTSRGMYIDTWGISESFGIVNVTVLSSDWPITSYTGTWNGEILEISGAGSGVVDNTNKMVTSDFVLTLKQGVLLGSETSTAKDCDQDRDVKGTKQ